MNQDTKRRASGEKTAPEQREAADKRQPKEHYTGRKPTEDHDAGGHGERGGQREESRRDNPRMTRGIHLEDSKGHPRTGGH